MVTKSMAVADHVPYASDPALSRGRLYPEPESTTRTCIQRDRDRIIHSTAFRRLEYKTQVFVNSEGDHYRTRLTHSLEVAQIARTIARALGLDEDLAELLALAHDLGHTPFGHAGEDALNRMMEPFGGFDHNAQSLAIVTRLENRYPEFDGLNLTWESLEGLVKHNGPLVGPDIDTPLPRHIAVYNQRHDLELSSYAGAEAQVAALADDIAYNNHDLDDGVRAALFTLEDLADVPLVGDLYRDVNQKYPTVDPDRRVAEVVRRLIGEMVSDCLSESRRRAAEANPGSSDDVRALSRPIVAFSDGMREVDSGLKEFLFGHMYRHEKVDRMTDQAQDTVVGLFGILMERPEALPSDWRKSAAHADGHEIAHIIADYIAGMTDRFAFDEFDRLSAERPNPTIVRSA